MSIITILSMTTDVFSRIVYPLLLALLLAFIIIPTIRRIVNRKKANTQTIDTVGTDDTDEPEIMETDDLDEDVMTTLEKQAYRYFLDDIENDGKKGGCLHKNKNDGITDEEYDRISTAKLNDFGSKARALDKLGIDETQVNEITPIKFYGFEKFSRRLNNNYMSKIGEDGRWRSSVLSITWLFFSNDEVLIYNGKFDMLTSAKREMTTEYFYKDITNFATLIETDQKIELKNTKSGCLKKKNNIDYERKLTDHDTFMLTVTDDKFSCSVSGVADVEQTVDGIKQKLREKKLF